MKGKMKRIFLFIIASLIAVGFDQWTKLQAVIYLKNQPPYVLWEGVFEFFYSENRGAAFGILQGKQTFFLIISVVVLCVVIYALCRMPVDKHYIPLEFCLVLITSGAIGNTIDRISRGYVVDFLYFKLIDFPIFNIADCYVVIATALMMFLFTVYYKDEDLVCFSLKKEGVSR